MKCGSCGRFVDGVSEEEWANIYTANNNLWDAYHKLVEKYEKETGKKYDIDAVMARDL